MKHNNKKIIIKTMSWRLVATSTSMLFLYLLSGQLELSLGLGVFEVFTRTALYFIHEKVWDGIVIK